jgi:N-acetylglucosamine-6-phosphate deacetylase
MALSDRYTLKNIKLVDDCRVGDNSAVVIKHGTIAYVGAQDRIPTDGLPWFDLGGWILCAGYIDLQLNGAYGYDFTTQPESIPVVARRLPQSGVVAYLPTFISNPLPGYHQQLSATLSAQLGKSAGARVLGAHLEGPFLNPRFAGVHQSSMFLQPTIDRLETLYPIEALRLMTLAVELPGGLQALDWLHEHGGVASIGHSAATSEQAHEYFSAGLGCATHLFNAMPPLHHRQPGLVGALLTTSGVRTSLIADGVHCTPEMLKLAYLCKGAQDIMLVTDAMAGLGMPPGMYTVAGQKVVVDGQSARSADGRLAGSVLSMDQAVRNMVTFTGCSIAEAIHMASAIPARVLGLEQRFGHVRDGYPADFLLLDEGLQIQATFINGTMDYATREASRRLGVEE